jgi:hypothetical protein
MSTGSSAPSCVNLDPTNPSLIGRSISDGACLKSDPTDIGAEWCAKGYCRQNPNLNCVLMTETDLNTISKIKANHDCDFSTGTSVMLECAGPNYCIENSN